MATTGSSAIGIARARGNDGSHGSTPGVADAAFVQNTQVAFDRLRETFLSGKTKTFEWRMSQLKAIERMLLESTDAMIEALAKDLHRPEYESIVADISATISEAREAMANLKYWMRPERVATNLVNQPGSSRIERVPKGVALIIGAWNFPINLCLAPALAAISAGNCVVIKPSEVTPACEALLAQLVAKYLDPTAVRVVCGGVKETTALLELPWNHVFYTGNGVVGKIVMAAAARNLTPVTLELGGKSPVIVDRGLSDKELRVACKRILHTSSYLNAGQICVAPDYILVHRDDEKRLLAMLTDVDRAFRTSVGGAPRAVVNARHYERLKGLMTETGGEVVVGGMSSGDKLGGVVPPTVVSRPNPNSSLMKEEVFGPVLSVLAVDSLDAAVEYLRGRDAPLVLYIFTNDAEAADRIIANTLSGGVLVNDCLMHLSNPNLPFGGVGASGFGSYKGRWGFEEFSHRRSVLHKSLAYDLDRYPPYTEAKVAMLRRMQNGELVPPRVKQFGVAAAAFALGAFIKSRL